MKIRIKIEIENILIEVLKMKKTKLGKIIKKVYDKINSKEFLEVSKMREKDFTRNRKMDFPKLMIFILSGTKKSLQSALFAFSSRFKFENGTYSKQAFSKARKKINPSAFFSLFKESVEMFYKDSDYKRYRGYRVMAIDGTKYNLPNSDEMKDIYGFQNSTNEQPQALGSCLYDVLNGIVIDAIVAPFNANERNLAKQHIEELSKIKTSKELLLMDRGYPSADLIAFTESKNINYIMRCSSQFLKGIKIIDNDCVITHKFKNSNSATKIRIIRFPINSGDNEVLITNIFDKNFTIDNFAELYHLRWNIEEKYDDLKNKLEIENFSGNSNIAVLQDFYATMFLNNIASIMALECEEEIKEHCKNNQLKHEYKANISLTISMMKFRLIDMFTLKSQTKRNKILDNIYHQLLISVTPVRPNRTFERNKKHKSQKFPNNRKSL